MANAPVRGRFWNGQSEILAGSTRRGCVPLGLRDLLLNEGDYDRARAMQMELLECQKRRLGPDDPGTVVARVELAKILMMALDHVPRREI